MSTLDISLIFKIAAVGILMIILDKVLKSGDKAEFAVITNLAGVILILMMILNLVSQLFNSMQMFFKF